MWLLHHKAALSLVLGESSILFSKEVAQVTFLLYIIFFVNSKFFWYGTFYSFFHFSFSFYHSWSSMVQILLIFTVLTSTVLLFFYPQVYMVLLLFLMYVFYFFICPLSIHLFNGHLFCIHWHLTFHHTVLVLWDSALCMSSDLQIKLWQKSWVTRQLHTCRWAWKTFPSWPFSISLSGNYDQSSEEM